MVIVRQLRAVFGQQRPIKWLVLVGLAVLLSLLEMLGAGLIFLLLTQVTEPGAPLELPVIGDPNRFFGEMPSEYFVYAVTVGVCLFFLIRGAILVFQKYTQARIVNHAGANVSSRLLSGYLQMPYQWHLRRNSAELVRNAFFNVNAVTRLLESAIKLVAETLIAFGLIVALLLLSPIATLIAVMVLAPMAFILQHVVRTRMREYGHEVKEAETEGLALAQQGFSGIRDLRIFNAERYFARAYGKTRSTQAVFRTRFSTVSELPRVLIETLIVLMLVGFFALTTARPVGDAASLPLLGLFAYVGVRMKPSIQAIISGINDIRHLGPSLDDVASDLDRLHTYAKTQEPLGATLPIPTLADRIVLSDVNYVYEGSEAPALSGINVEIPAGTSLGIVGATGGGKSTLVDVIAGLLTPTTGMLTVDGVDIHAADTRSWHRQLGVVSQAVFIMDATVRENIALGVSFERINEAALLEAVRLAQLESVLEELPEGLDSRLGERGTRLSGGQRQRVAIARALYRRSQVLIFDEGTAALDVKTEAELIANLERLHGQKTMLLVAHRLATVRHCDRIVVVESGRITEAGTFEELVERHPLFSDMRIGPNAT